MLEINEDDVYCLSENIFLHKISELEKYWAFNIDSGEHYSLNETSFWIVERIAGTVPLKSILEEFLETFDVDNKQGKNDFCEVITGFVNEGIIRKEDNK
ncbi:MAG: PqqD family protein [Deltaproteobacteria bacterium]|nr:PqqD family protein [Deltaproteobacteria bacterium]